MKNDRSIERIRCGLIESGLLSPLLADIYAKQVVEYFGTCPISSQFEYWWRNVRQIGQETERQSVGIVAWDGDA